MTAKHIPNFVANLNSFTSHHKPGRHNNTHNYINLFKMKILRWKPTVTTSHTILTMPSLFCDVMRHSLIAGYRRFGTAYRAHLHDSKQSNSGLFLPLKMQPIRWPTKSRLVTSRWAEAWNYTQPSPWFFPVLPTCYLPVRCCSLVARRRRSETAVSAGGTADASSCQRQRQPSQCRVAAAGSALEAQRVSHRST